MMASASLTAKSGKIFTADSLSGRLARGGAWSLAGAAVSQGANLGASILIARLLGRDQFGQYGMVQSTVGMLGTFAGLGLGVTATKYVAELRSVSPQRAGRILALSCAVAIVSGALLALWLLAYSTPLASRTLHAPALRTELRISSLLLFFNALNGMQTGGLAGFEAFRSIARINLVKGLATFPVTVVAVLRMGLPGAIWALVFTAALACLLCQVSLHKHCSAVGIRAEYSSAWMERRILWLFSAPAFLSGALVGPVVWLATTMLVSQPGGYAQMAIFSAATQWRNAIAFVPSVLAQLALPILANLNGERNATGYHKALRWNLIATTAAAILVACPVALASPLIMQMYGRGFREGWVILVLSAATAVIACINSVVGTAILSAGSVWVGLAFNAMWAAVLLGGCYFTIPTRFAFGLTSSMLAAYIAHSIWQAVYLRARLRRAPSGSPDLSECQPRLASSRS